MASLTSVAEVRSVVTTGLSDDDLQGVIDREEAWLARKIGQLAGERTQLFYIGDAAPLYLEPMTDPSTIWYLSDRMGPLGLQRPVGPVMAGTPPAATIAVTDNGTALEATDIRLVRRNSAIERASGGWTGPIVSVTYTPDDELEVKRVVIELCRMAGSAGVSSETIGDYSYTLADQPATKRELVRDLLPHPPAGTMAIRSSSDDDRVGAVT